MLHQTVKIITISDVNANKIPNIETVIVLSDKCKPRTMLSVLI